MVYKTIVDRVAKNTATVVESSSTYTPYLGVMREIGAIVQGAYDAEAVFVEELKAMRASYGL